MPKLKTNRGAAKRFRRTASGKIKARSAKSRHIFTKETAKIKRHRRGQMILKKCDQRIVERLIGAIKRRKRRQKSGEAESC